MNSPGNFFIFVLVLTSDFYEFKTIDIKSTFISTRLFELLWFISVIL